MWDKTIEEVLEKTNSNKNGLTKKQALQRQMINGKNKLPKGKEKTILDVLIDQFKSPIILILIISAIFSIFIGSFADAIFIIIVISINAFIGTYQEWNSKKSAEKLQDMIKIKTRVIRDGKSTEIDSEDVVVRRYC